MPEKGSAHWTAVLDDLQRRLADANKQVRTLEIERRPLVLSAKTGDKAAQSQLDRLTERQRAAERELADLSMALEQGSAEQAKAEAHEALALKAQRTEEARDLIIERAKAADAVDEALADLAKAHTAYYAAGRKLEAYEDLHHKTSAQLSQFFPVGNAFAHADTALFRALDGRPVGRQPLVEYESDMWSSFFVREKEAAA